MSKALATLVRMHRWRLDEKRKTVTELERLRDGLRAQERRLTEELTAEKAKAGESLEAARTFPAYLGDMRGRQEKLAKSIAETEARIEAANADLAESFREYKKHETVLSDRLRRARAEADRQQQAALDEMALQGHRRREGTDE